jgi:uncharacterized protein (TIGR03435 family)
MVGMGQIAGGCVVAVMVSANAFALQTPGPQEGGAAKAPKFEVASIRMIPAEKVVPIAGSPISPPGAGEFTMHEVTLALAIAWAFGVDQNNVAGGPAWVNSQCYEIAAKPEGDVGLSYAQVRPLLQQLIQERFHLAYHWETEKRKGYALVVAKGGPKLTASKSEGGHGYLLKDRIQAQDRSAAVLASLLELSLGKPVIDETGLKVNFDFDLNFAPMDGTESSLPSIFTALEEQLGLKLEEANVPVKMFMIDHVDRVPTEN